MMPQEQWTAVDRYLAEQFIGPDPVLERALADSAAAGLPPISVSPTQGKLLHILARLVNARRILEIGTLGGYSTIWLARALPPDGRLVTLEYEPKHAAVASANLSRAGLSALVDLRIGEALQTLPQLQAEQAGPFDFTFIDADKQSTREYFQWALKLSRPGGLIVVDNVVRSGGVINADSADASVQGIRRFNQSLAQHRGVVATAIQTVGVKGYDGFAVVLAPG